MNQPSKNTRPCLDLPFIPLISVDMNCAMPSGPIVVQLTGAADSSNKLSGARRVCGQGLLELGCFLSALLENGIAARSGNL